MSKRILVISTSLREKSNSQALGDAFAAGAREAGHQVEQISLRGRSIAFCMGCLACQSVGQCVIQDDAVEIAEKMGRAEVIAFATPIYYYEMSGQMKTLLDRANALFASDYAFRDIYLLTAAAEGFAPANCVEAVRACGATIVSHARQSALADVVEHLERRYG